MNLKNKLAVAITTALLSVGSYAAGGLTAITTMADIDDSAAAVGGTLGTCATSNSAATEDAFGANGCDSADGNPDGGIPTYTDAVIGTPVTFATEMFNVGSPTLPSTSTDHFAVMYQAIGDIAKATFFFDFTLTNAKFNLAALYSNYDIAKDCADNANAAAMTIHPGTIDGNKVTFKVELTKPDANPVGSCDKFALVYTIKDATASSGAVNLKAETYYKDSGQNRPAGITDDIDIADFAAAISITLTPSEINDAKVLSETGKEYVKWKSSVNGDVYETSDKVTLGVLKLVNGGVKDSTAKNDFTFGNDDAELTSATLVISEGDFTAAATAPGRVTVQEAAVNATFDAENKTATFDLTSTIGNITDGVTAPNVGGIIEMAVDGTTDIGTPENNPCALLTVDYADSNMKDFTVPESGACIDLPRIIPDGTICQVGIIPNTGQNDKISILITNNTNDDDVVKGTLYAQDGTEVFPLTVLKGDGHNGIGGTDGVLKAGQTMRVSADSLAELAGGTMDLKGRGSLRITTTLSDIEVMAFIRDSSTNINSNVSTGASGVSCVN
ncbi:hypothetical protein QUF50_03540 [Thiotrichales bacterium HSG1]|nr:hypothetical protein [Thiotrichales bacterium HSG1]